MKKFKHILLLLIVAFSSSLGILAGCNTLTKYQISLYVSNSRAGSVVGGGEYSMGETITIKANSADNTSYIWQGWYLGDTLYTTDEIFEYKVQKKDISFTAKWSGIIVDVYCFSDISNSYPQNNFDYSSYILSYGSHNGTMGLECGTSNITFYDENLLIKEGYTFEGWYSDPNLTNQITDNNGVLLQNSTFTNELYLFAKWQIKSGDVNFISNSKFTIFNIYESSNGVDYTLTTKTNFNYGTKIKVEISNEGILSNQTAFESLTNSLNIDYQLVDNILYFTMPEENIEFNAKYTLPSNNYELLVVNNQLKIVNYFGNEETLFIPDYMVFNNVKYKVGIIAAKAFKDNENLKNVVIPYSIVSIENGAFKDTTFNVMIDERLDLNLVKKEIFENSNLYINIIQGYDIFMNTDESTLSSSEKEIKSLMKGYFVNQNGVICKNIIESEDEFFAMFEYLYSHNLSNNIIWKIKFQSNSIDATKINKITTSYTSNLYLLNGASITKADSQTGEHYFTFQNIFSNSNQIASVNSRTAFEDKYKDDTTKTDIFYVNSLSNVSSYSLNPDLDRNLNIENSEKFIVCSTSEQLLNAIEKGFRPIFLDENSNAKLVYDKAKEILRNICDDDMSEYQKALAIHDYIISNTIIDNFLAEALSDLNYGTTDPYAHLGIYAYRSLFLEGVLFDGIGNYNGYSKTFSLLCNMEGIDTIRYIGKIKIGTVQNIDEVSSQQYIWNKINLNIDGIDRWYNVDVIADDMPVNGDPTMLEISKFEVLSHTLFLISDSDMKIINKENIQEYVVNGGTMASYEYESKITSRFYQYENSKFNYKNTLYSTFIRDEDEIEPLSVVVKNYISELQQNLDSGIFTFEITINGELTNDSTDTDIFYQKFSSTMLISNVFTQNGGENCTTTLTLLYNIGTKI